MFENLTELAGLAGTLWGAWQTFRRRREAAELEHVEEQRAHLERRLEAASELAQRFARALELGDLVAMRAIEAERKERGL